jgi:hypothetical protein
MLSDIAQCEELFHTATGTAFADVIIADHQETWPIRSKRCRWNAALVQPRCKRPHQRQQDLAPIGADAPSREHRPRLWPGRRRSAMPSEGGRVNAHQAAERAPYFGLRADYVDSLRTSTRLTGKKSIVRRRPVVTHDPVTLMVVRARPGAIAITR